MIVYLITIALVTAFSLMAVKYAPVTKPTVKNGPQLLTHKRHNTFAVWLVFFCLAFVAVFRYGVGTDFFAYYNGSSWANKFQNGDYSEPGFTLLALLCDTLFGGQKGALTMVSAALTVALFVFTIAKRSETFPISILLFVLTGCYTGMFNGVRQYLAAAILFAGHRFIIKKKPIKWLLVVLVASSFHITSILMFFVYFICNLKCNWFIVFVYFVTALLLLYFYEPLFNLVGALKQDEIDVSDEYMTNNVNILRIAVQCVPLIMFLFVNKKKVNEDKECRFLFNICLLNAAIAVAAMNSAYLSRFYIYTSCFQILMYPKMFNKMGKDNKLLFTVLLIFFYALYWIYELSIYSSLNNFRWIFKYL